MRVGCNALATGAANLSSGKLPPILSLTLGLCS